MMYRDPEEKMSIIEHLEELRRRILISLAFFVSMSIFIFIHIQKIIYILRLPASNIIENMIFTAPQEVFVSYIRVALIVGFIISLFFILIQAWLFLRPAIPRHQRNQIKAWFVAGFILAFIGLAFSYFLAIPFALRFLIGLSKGIATPMITISRYLSFVSTMLLVGAAIFQIPIIIGILSHIGVVNYRFLSRHRKYAIVIIAIISAIITPTQDIVNMLIFSIPMWLLYEAGIIISWLIEKGRRIYERPKP